MKSIEENNMLYELSLCKLHMTVFNLHFTAAQNTTYTWLQGIAESS